MNKNLLVSNWFLPVLPNVRIYGFCILKFSSTNNLIFKIIPAFLIKCCPKLGFMLL
ncbi:unnamed protein product [Moneuplotes crassus]|uniref:Uncharacterized protein n=1 Tax=Euplotes crassus TaxID=5936 RepID=A0AAD2D333_EUPCR|nr:unnamed protein product [Moneuplotes crassus]